MGGLGSGRGRRPGRWSGRPLVDRDMWKLDVFELNRDQALMPGASRPFAWFFDGHWRKACMAMDDDALTLTISWKETVGRDGGVGNYSQAIDLDWSETLISGYVRPSFFCPVCEARVAVLWGGEVFVCRRCHGGKYLSQYADCYDRRNTRGEVLRKRLQIGPNESCLFFPKPKYMHLKTFKALRAELRSIELAVIDQFVFECGRADFYEQREQLSKLLQGIRVAEGKPLTR